ncbi:hypothetical protein MYCTH_2108494 [Thermothelomyces thermophilus ATCC 42464]|uniref:Uncharacterized protein n=1 Tax=Thermothelomyces thermophilus (strain ATCC 42464 / BCRC 31852 / DSM 1799) TaxID=573729 RepID=G2QAS3_THET4|nr:uncharacterized protein MYCTH_2108494 [Thermothelomyces thermophilus ATCC 42464]AEO55915.1 hypothetical protein MYCTH_2108494 [Thermothelomyces thermophilus ATCC 42464]
MLLLLLLLLLVSWLFGNLIGVIFAALQNHRVLFVPGVVLVSRHGSDPGILRVWARRSRSGSGRGRGRGRGWLTVRRAVDAQVPGQNRKNQEEKRQNPPPTRECSCRTVSLERERDIEAGNKQAGASAPLIGRHFGLILRPYPYLG